MTSREAGFQPEFGRPWHGPFTVKLNSTPFASISDYEPSRLDVMHGARRTSYTERQYFGNPGGYGEWVSAFGIGVDLDHIRVVPDPKPGRLSAAWSKAVEALRRLRRGHRVGELGAAPALEAGTGGAGDGPGSPSGDPAAP